MIRNSSSIRPSGWKCSGYHTFCALTAREGRDLIARARPSLLLLDYELDEGTGLDLAAIAIQQLPDARIVLLSGQADHQLCRASWRSG